MKMYKKFLEVLILIISILFFLQNCFAILVAGDLSECYRVRITGYNREEIVSLMKENIDCYIKIPDVSRAKEIEYNNRFLDSELIIYYEDGTTYDLGKSGGDNSPLILYIQDQGYKVYYRSLEFAIDLIKWILSIVLIVFFVVKVFDI